MPDSIPRSMLRAHYFHAAQEYLRKLRLENIMEATPQATQRKITLESLDLVHAHRPDIQHFNELLVQYPVAGRRKPGQVVPDNMVVVHPEPIQAEGSYDVPLEPARPFWMLEYVSKSNHRKDYVRNMVKYEQELQVPYYLMFTPDAEELILYHHNGQKYVTVLPNEHGRYPIPDLELELGILGGWVRYWFRGELLPLPADLQRQLDQARNEAAAARQEAATAQQEAATAQQEAATAQQEAATARKEATEAQQIATTAVTAQKALETELARLRQLLGQHGQASKPTGETGGTDPAVEPRP